MGIKKMFMKKDPTEEEIREDLNRVGISTKSGKVREEKFGAFKNYAQERAQMKGGLKPVNPYANAQDNDPKRNPYASGDLSNSSATLTNTNGSNPSSNPSNPATSVSSAGGGGSSPYGQRQQPRSSSYDVNPRPRQAVPTPSPSPMMSSSQSSPYGQSRSKSSVDAYSQSRAAPGQRSSSSEGLASASRVSTRQTTSGDTDSSLDLNAINSHQMFRNTKPIKKQTFDDELDLNEEYEEQDAELDLNLDIPEEQQEVNSEDEEVDAIKQDIRFVKQESVQSTRNTLRMAQEADASGTNTLGMLGSQSERLFNAEQNLLLADTQTQIADEKVKELKRLNRSIFVPAQGNPFNKKSRLRQQEETIKNRKLQEKLMRENNRQGMYESEQRLKQGITNNATNNDVHQKYQNEKYLSQASRYQFENDSEDDEMEKELASNLDQIGVYAKKLHGIANTMGKEVDSQNVRLRKIEEDADKLDINVHMNSTRLSNIR
ncbi:uncharacterized protein LODBEIA_P43420 [Lodderomyces beijingensis]|uniref:t-SNARE coiled-coil homology domain-containing protein n=1 Tax=Lodderomyces beijingensis TaxID=1775926 RepID=A0ABP0ZPM6_9ASCO